MEEELEVPLSWGFWHGCSQRKESLSRWSPSDPDYPGALHAGEWSGKLLHTMEREVLSPSSDARALRWALQARPPAGGPALSQLPEAFGDR